MRNPAIYRLTRQLILSVMVFFLFYTLPSSVFAQQYTRFTDYAYISGTEITLNGDTLDWTGSAFYGPFHFNSVFKADAAIFTDPVFCAQPRFNVGGQYLNGLTFNADSIAFPDTLHRVREIASMSGNYFSNHGGRWQSRINVHNGCFLFEQWESGAPYDSTSLVDHMAISYGSNVCVFIEGDLQIASRLHNPVPINGQMSIGCSGKMKLMDDVLIDPYTNEDFPYVIPEDTYSRLALLAEGDILIGNTNANGRGNGFHMGNGSHDRAHIVITASLITLGQFTIEDQNNPDDAYIWCDPNGPHPDVTDERGTIFLRGSLAQRQRGKLHNSNCGGTGYDLDFYYDERMATYPPNGIPIIGPEEEQIVIRDVCTWQDTTIHVTQPIYLYAPLTLGPGTTIYANLGERPLFQFWNRLFVNGEAENPVTIVFTDSGEHPSTLVYNNGEIQFWDEWNYYADNEWSGLHVYADRLLFNVPISLTDSKLVADHIELNSVSEEDLEHTITNSILIADTILCTTQTNRFVDFESNLVIGSLFNKFSTIDRCTFIDPGNARCAITNDQDRYVTVRSCFFQGYEAALVRGSGGQLDYCAYDQFPNGYPFWNPMEVGENILANVDPMFVEPDSMNYYLLPGSPLIDAGSPDSPRDPDRSIADIGAYWCDPTDVPDDLTRTESLPTAFRIASVYPNPFNPVTEVSLALPRSGDVRVELVDILGRSVAVVHDGLMLAGMQTMTINGASLASGTYFLRVRFERETLTQKIVLLK